MARTITIDNINNVLSFKHPFEGDTSHLYTSHTDAVRKEDGATTIDMDRIYEYGAAFQDFLEALRANNCIVFVREEASDDSDDSMEKADITTVLGILSSNIRAERFCTGTWAGLIRSGFFKKALVRLEEIRDEMVKEGQNEIAIKMDGAHE